MTPVEYLASMVLLLFIAVIITVWGVVELWITATGQSEKYHTNMVDSPPEWAATAEVDAMTARIYNGIRGAVICAWGGTTVLYTLGLGTVTAFALPFCMTIVLYGGFTLGTVVYTNPA